MQLDITVNSKKVGILTQTGKNAYVFEYAQHIEDQNCISVTMLPSQSKIWHSTDIPTPLMTSLPEGGVRQLLSRKLSTQAGLLLDDFQLLSALGPHLIGRVHAKPQSLAYQSASTEIASKELSYLLQNTGDKDIKQELFDSLLDFAGVSGGFDKVLTSTPNHWIVKMDDDDHPALAVNEYLGMELCRRSGMPTPEVKLSGDLHRLLVGRFDIKPDGSRYGFEDFCSLFGLHPNMKFSGSMEKLSALMQKLVSAQHLQSCSKQLYQHHVVNMAIRNGDAHLKNFAILYDSPNDVRLSPVYDVLAMSAYAPRAQDGDALDKPSLTVNGSHRWPAPKELRVLADRLSISETEQALVSDAVCESMHSMIPDFQNLAASDFAMRPTIARIAYLWGCGTAIHSQTLAQDFYDCSKRLDI